MVPLEPIGSIYSEEDIMSITFVNPTGSHTVTVAAVSAADIIADLLLSGSVVTCVKDSSC